MQPSVSYDNSIEWDRMVWNCYSHSWRQCNSGSTELAFSRLQGVQTLIVSSHLWLILFIKLWVDLCKSSCHVVPALIQNLNDLWPRGRPSCSSSGAVVHGTMFLQLAYLQRNFKFRTRRSISLKYTWQASDNKDGKVYLTVDLHDHIMGGM